MNVDSFFIKFKPLKSDRPSDPFTTFEHENPWHVIPELRKIRRFPDFEDPKL